MGNDYAESGPSAKQEEQQTVAYATSAAVQSGTTTSGPPVKHKQTEATNPDEIEAYATTAMAQGGKAPKADKLQQQQTKDVYAQPDKSKKTKNGPDASAPIELYAQPDKSKKQKKAQPKRDEYSEIDKDRKKQVFDDKLLPNSYD